MLEPVPSGIVQTDPYNMHSASFEKGQFVVKDSPWVIPPRVCVPGISVILVQRHCGGVIDGIAWCWAAHSVPRQVGWSLCQDISYIIHFIKLHPESRLASSILCVWLSSNE